MIFSFLLAQYFKRHALALVSQRVQLSRRRLRGKQEKVSKLFLKDRQKMKIFLVVAEKSLLLCFQVTLTLHFFDFQVIFNQFKSQNSHKTLMKTFKNIFRPQTSLSCFLVHVSLRYKEKAHKKSQLLAHNFLMRMSSEL